MLDRFDRLRHDTVVSGDHQHDDIGQVGAAGTHGREGGMARGIQKSNLVIVELHRIGTDVLGNAAGLAGHHTGVADLVEQRGLAVVDMPHKGHHRRTGKKRIGSIFNFLFLPGRNRLGLRWLNGRLFLFFLAHFKSVLLADLLRNLQIDFGIDRGEDIHLHQFGDDHVGLHAHAFGKFLYHNLRLLQLDQVDRGFFGRSGIVRRSLFGGCGFCFAAGFRRRGHFFHGTLCRNVVGAGLLHGGIAQFIADRAELFTVQIGVRALDCNIDVLQNLHQFLGRDAYVFSCILNIHYSVISPCSFM